MFNRDFPERFAIAPLLVILMFIISA